MTDGNQASYYHSFMHITSTSLKVVFIQKYNNVPPQLTQTKSEGVIVMRSFRGEEQMEIRRKLPLLLSARAHNLHCAEPWALN